jgi:hypothetical protein
MGDRTPKSSAGGPLPEKLVSDIRARSEGNAYYAEELLAEGMECLPSGAVRHRFDPR